MIGRVGFPLEMIAVRLVVCVSMQCSSATVAMCDLPADSHWRSCIASNSAFELGSVGAAYMLLQHFLCQLRVHDGACMPAVYVTTVVELLGQLD